MRFDFRNLLSWGFTAANFTSNLNMLNANRCQAVTTNASFEALNLRGVF